MRLWVPAFIISAIFVAFSIGFVIKTPYRTSGKLAHQRVNDIPDIGAPDERQHANYVAWIMRGEGLKKLDPTDPQLYENYQAHQPPLYYFVAGGFCKLFGIDPLYNNGWQLRFLSTILGVVTIFGLFCGAFWVTQNKKFATVVACVALMPMVIALNSAVSNDPLLILLATWALAFMGRIVTGGLNLKVALMTGGLVGLACLTRTAAITLLLPLILCLFLIPSTEKILKSRGPVLLAIFIAIILPAPFWIRNLSLYGDPFALSAFKLAFQGSPQAGLFIDSLGASQYWLNMVLWWTFRSFIGCFGYMDIFMFEGLGMLKSDQIYFSLSVILTVLLVMSLTKAKAVALNSKWRNVAIIHTAFFLAIVLAFLQFNGQYFQGQARYIYPALFPIAMILGTGLYAISKSKSWIPVALICVFFVVLDYDAIREISEGFAIRTGTSTR